MWLKAVRENCEAELPRLLLIGNKSDLRDSRVVLREEAEQLADEHKMVYIETSARDNTNLDMAFEEIADQVYQKHFAAATSDDDEQDG